MAAMSGRLVGRDPELKLIEGFLDEIRAGFAVVLLEGEAGIGKSALFEACLDLARSREYRVLVCRPAASEANLAFASLGDLLEEALDEALPALTDPQRRALQVALVREAAAEG